MVPASTGRVAIQKRLAETARGVAMPADLRIALGIAGQDGVLIVSGPAQPVRREADVHAAVVALAVFAAAGRLPVGELETPSLVGRAVAAVHQASAITTG